MYEPSTALLSDFLLASGTFRKVSIAYLSSFCKLLGIKVSHQCINVNVNVNAL